MENPDRPPKRRRVDRVLAACDFCKARKVKCNGAQPCDYCAKRNRAESCTFSRAHASPTVSGPLSGPPRPTSGVEDDVPDTTAAFAPPANDRFVRSSDSRGTAVPLEARLLRDDQGKAIFIGDCAPLSFLQSVRHLVAAEVDAEALSAQASRDSVIEITPPEATTSSPTTSLRSLQSQDIRSLVASYLVATNGLVDLFDGEKLADEIATWTRTAESTDDVSTAVYYLVLAIGSQERHDTDAKSWFNTAKSTLLAKLCSSMNVSTIQGFVLITLYMLRASQPNGAYLYFSLAARTAYAIGIHRTEVNASFGREVHALRDRIWKSLRIVDMLISCTLARPPSTSNVDCTVKYAVTKVNGDIYNHMLDASVEIFLIIERVVIEVYSRKRISLRIANFVARQLKAWAAKWYGPLRDLTTEANLDSSPKQTVVGACQVICSYLYGIMLLTRPFLVYDLSEYLGASVKQPTIRAEAEERKKFANAAFDAARTLSAMVHSMIKLGHMPKKMPLVVSWLFNASLVLTVGMLGPESPSNEEYCQISLKCLEHFADSDPHARQHLAIVKGLHEALSKHMEKRESQNRNKRKEASAQLFGLDVTMSSNESLHAVNDSSHFSPSYSRPEDSVSNAATADWSIYDADFFSVPWFNQSLDESLQGFLQPGRPGIDLPLFPMDDQFAWVPGAGGLNDL